MSAKPLSGSIGHLLVLSQSNCCCGCHFFILSSIVDPADCQLRSSFNRADSTHSDVFAHGTVWELLTALSTEST